MEEQNGSKNNISVCRYNQTGYCRNRSWCDRPHCNTICQQRVCRNRNCIERHPKTCKYFAKYNSCSYKDKCAYTHPKSRGRENQDKLENEITLLKEEVEKLSAANACIINKLNHIEIENAKLKKEQSDIHEEVNIMKAKNIKITKKKKNTSCDQVKDIKMKCDICSFNAETKTLYENTLIQSTQSQNWIE